LPLGPLADWVAEAASPDRPPVIHIDKGPEAPFDLVCHLAPLDPGAGGGEYLLTLLNVTEFRNLDRVKSEFVANASHELKTPLSSLKGYAEALVERALEDPKVRLNFAKKIHANALRLERLVQDLLSLSRLETGQPPRENEPLPLRGYVHAAAGHHRDALDAAGIRLENHVPEDARVAMEARDLELILDNLVGNAVRYNKPGGKIKIWTEPDEGGGLKLSVKDTGIGIAPEMLPRIFERFYRADASRARKDGTGLGLAIVKHAAAKYGMAVSAESIPGEGSRFMVGIPKRLLAPP
jgi:two-component system phosphate regulon sensor histidine kinase PhoR